MCAKRRSFPVQAIRDNGDWEGWLKFFLRGIYEVAKEATETARTIVNLREAHRALVTERLGRGASKALLVLEVLCYRPIISVHAAMKATKLSYANTNRLVKDLCNLGLLLELTGQKRNRRFSYEPYLSLFRDTESDVPIQ